MDVKEVKLPIKKRNRTYGLLTWPQSFDFDIISMLEKQDFVTYDVDGKVYNQRKVSYKYRRFAFSRKIMWKYPDATQFVLKKHSSGKIKITLE